MNGKMTKVNDCNWLSNKVIAIPLHFFCGLAQTTVETVCCSIMAYNIYWGLCSYTVKWCCNVTINVIRKSDGLEILLNKV